jgi:formylglycine-generating enzyme required for sulfatase activity
MAAEGGAPGSLDQQRLTSQVAGNRFPDWSPDGSQIAFSSMRDGNSEIYVMDADGSNQQRLTFNDAEDWDPAWSPDGTQIAFRSRRDGNWEIYAMNADGSNQRRLTNTSADDHYPAWWPSMELADDSQVQAVGDTRIRPADGMTMVYVPAGQFEMGSDDDSVDYAMQLCSELSDRCQRRWYEDQQPAHTVALDGFWIDKYEVTNAQYQKCVEAGECQTPTMCNWGQPTYGEADKADHPAVCVDWQGAQDYCEWAGRRLPTEAEWEYAARGPAGNVFPWGDTFDGTLANSCDTNCTQDWKYTGYDDGYAQTAPVGSYPDGVSWCGAEDMAGNVWEWVSDWYDSDYYRISPTENPGGPSSGEHRVARGGSWRDGSNGELHLATFRYYPGVPSLRTSNVGFRCAAVSPGE